MVATATAARADGLHVWLQPRLFNRPHGEMVDHLAETARAAEQLRTRYGEVYLTVGVELSVFAPGMVAGDTFRRTVQDGLNDLLARLLSIARSRFGGSITYGAGPWEDVDWTGFDLVGLDYYPELFDAAARVGDLPSYRRWGKPIAAVEFGRTTSGVMPTVDWSLPVPEITSAPPASDEQAQADHLVKRLDLFEAERLHAAMVFEFIEPSFPSSTQPRRDLERASWANTRVVRENPDDPASPYRWHGKQTFHALARRNRAST